MKNLDLFINYLNSYAKDDYFVESAVSLYNIFKYAEIIGNSDIIEIIEETKKRGVDDLENIVRDDYLYDHYEEEVGDLVVEKVEEVWGVGHETYLVKRLYENRYNISGLDSIGIDSDFEEAESCIVNREIENLKEVIEEVIEEVEEIEEIRKAFDYVVENKRLFFEALGSLDFDAYYKNATLMGTASDSLENITDEAYRFIEKVISY